MGKRSRRRMAETRVNCSTTLLKKFSSHLYHSGRRKEGCQPGRGVRENQGTEWQAQRVVAITKGFLNICSKMVSPNGSLRTAGWRE